MRTRISWMALVTVVALAHGSALFAADPPTTTITVPDMHCMGCAKKMAGKLYAVRGVAKVEASVETTSLTVTPKAQETPSARALWEAVEKAGYKPSRLEGPSGTFTEKPRS